MEEYLWTQSSGKIILRADPTKKDSLALRSEMDPILYFAIHDKRNIVILNKFIYLLYVYAPVYCFLLSNKPRCKK